MIVHTCTTFRAAKAPTAACTVQHHSPSIAQVSCWALNPLGVDAAGYVELAASLFESWHLYKILSPQTGLTLSYLCNSTASTRHASSIRALLCT